ncbi:MAG: hypothetical protein IKX19_01535 [Clostridia bacterium]|nr:hypothetical protein [Clostridia bacterium]
MGRQYIYPADLKSEPRLWLWSLKDLAALGIALIVSVLALTQVHFYPPMVGTMVFGILTIRADDQSVLDFLKRAVRFFFADPQEFYWQEKSVGSHCRREEAQTK